MLNVFQNFYVHNSLNNFIFSLLGKLQVACAPRRYLFDVVILLPPQVSSEG